MDALKAMNVFTHVAKHRGFASAAMELGMSTSSVSRQIANLEDLFGAELFTRTTRYLHLTDAGAEILDRCTGIVNDFDSLLASERRSGGRLKMTMPHFISTVLAHEFFPRFAHEHPEIDLELVVTDRVVNLVEGKFDLAVRVGQLPDSRLIARKVMDLRLAIVGSPGYLERRGVPRTPDDLRKHNCIIDTVAPYRDRWPLKEGGSVEKLPVNGNVRVNSGSAARDLCLGGAGLSLLPEALVYPNLRAGTLVSVMRDQVPVGGGIYIIYPKSRHPTAAQKTFAEELIAYARSAARITAANAL